MSDRVGSVTPGATPRIQEPHKAGHEELLGCGTPPKSPTGLRSRSPSKSGRGAETSQEKANELFNTENQEKKGPLPPYDAEKSPPAYGAEEEAALRHEMQSYLKMVFPERTQEQWSALPKSDKAGLLSSFMQIKAADKHAKSSKALAQANKDFQQAELIRTQEKRSWEIDDAIDGDQKIARRRKLKLTDEDYRMKADADKTHIQAMTQIELQKNQAIMQQTMSMMQMMTGLIGQMYR